MFRLLDEARRRHSGVPAAADGEASRQRRSAPPATTKMDPLGFGLENYDAIGKWRTKDGKFPVDSSGTLPNGKTFSSPAEMRALLTSAAAASSRAAWSEKMLTYSLGRGLRRYDRRTVDEISAQAGPRPDYPFQSLIFEIVHSLPFQSAARRNQPPVRMQPNRRRLLRNDHAQSASTTNLSRGAGNRRRASVPRRHGPGARYARSRRSRPCAWRSSTCRTASTCATGIRTTKASWASCRAS